MKNKLGVLTVFLLCSFTLRSEDKPNILWITSEDNNTSWVGCYGNEFAQTPNIDRLAKEGFRYEHCYANSPVCAPSRFTWLTGVHAISAGTHPMRSGYQIPKDFSFYNKVFADGGYFITNQTKTDYNYSGFDANGLWDSQKDKSLKRKGQLWRYREEGQPFFAVVNVATSHESRAFGDFNDLKHDPQNIKLKSYHPDIPVIRKNYAKYHDAVQKMDSEVGQLLKALEMQGLDGDTIVVYCSDHGGVMPRSKRFLYDSGVHCPLIIRIPEKFKRLWPADQPGSVIDRMVSFVDMPKTWISIAGLAVPEKMQGNIFLGEGLEPEADYHFAWRARMDKRIDNVRSVRNKRYVYIKNYMPNIPRGQYLNYLWKMEATRAWEKEFLEGRCNEVTGRFFMPRNEVEEFYDRVADPDNVNNLIHDPAYEKEIDKARNALRHCQVKLHDTALLPEVMMKHKAQQHKTTIYELVRNAEWYDVEGYLNAADIALAKDKNNLGELLRMLDSEDQGLRWWGAYGLVLLEKDAVSAKEVLTKLLSDESDHVRIAAAWSLINIGEREVGLKTFSSLVESSKDPEFVLNVLDWLAGKAFDFKQHSLMETSGGNIKSMFAKLRSGYQEEEHNVQVK